MIYGIKIDKFRSCGGKYNEIREIKREDIPVCVDLITKSFMTVANELGFTKANAPRFTAFATTSDRLYWQMDNENRQMYVFEENGILCGYYSLLMQTLTSVNLIILRYCLNTDTMESEKITESCF